MEKDEALFIPPKEEKIYPALYLVSVEEVSEKEQSMARHPTSLVPRVEVPDIPRRAS